MKQLYLQVQIRKAHRDPLSSKAKPPTLQALTKASLSQSRSSSTPNRGKQQLPSGIS